MNSKPPKSYPDKPKKAPKQSQGYPVTQTTYKPEKKKAKSRYPPKRYANDQADPNYYAPYKRKPDRNATYIYKQDLIQKGFQIYGAQKIDNATKDLCERFPECFTTNKRKVIIDPYVDQNDELSMVSKSRIQGKEELHDNLEHLMDNEDIPDWYFDSTTNEKTSAFFDFSSTVNRTKEVNFEISRQVKEGMGNQNEGPKAHLDDEINFEELDQLLEKKFISAKKEQSIDEEALEDLEAFESDHDESSDEQRQRENESPQYSNNKQHRKNSQSLNDSKNESHDYFYNLQTNIKKMLFNKEESASEEDKDSEESFQESLGFECNRDRKNNAQPTVSDTSNILPKTEPVPVKAPEPKPVSSTNESNQITLDLKPQTNVSQFGKNVIPPFNPQFPLPPPIPYPPNFKLPPQPPIPTIKPPVDMMPREQQQRVNLPPLNLPTMGTVSSNLPLNKMELENPIIDLSKIEEYKNITPEERESRKIAFLDRYGYLDPIMCQIVYEILNSKQRQTLNKFSINGFNQKSVEKYCQNKYKIFSLYMQGDIISKVWLYKDKLGHIQGPFMSYDMDIWNGEANYFAEDLKIALMNSPFIPLQLYLDRAQIVIDVVQNFLLKNERSGNDSGKGPNEGNKRGNKKYAFHKKSETEKEVVLPPSYKSPTELTNNFAENFPPLAETSNKAKNPKLSIDEQSAPKKQSMSTGGEPSLLDTLRSTLNVPASYNEQRKSSIQDQQTHGGKGDHKMSKNAQTSSTHGTHQVDQKNFKPDNSAPQEQTKMQQSPTVQPEQAKDVAESKNAKTAPKKEAASVIVQKNNQQAVNSKKDSTKKRSRKTKGEIKDPYADADSNVQYVEKVDTQEKAGPAPQNNHNDLTLSIKSMLGLNLK